MDRSKTSSPDYRVTEAAASWFLRIQDGFSQSDFREWRRWLAEDDSHADAFDDVAKFWQAVDGLDDVPWPGAQDLASDTYDGHAPLLLPRNSEQRTRFQRRGRRFWLAAAASIVAVGLIGLLVKQEVGPQAGNYQTTTAEHRTVPLDDGSTIMLGAQSDVVVAYTGSIRRIELRIGEAYFKVAKDANRPFVVAAGARTVRALGTEFGINIGVRDIRVSVVEGQVRVEGLPPLGAGGRLNSSVPIASDLGKGDVLDFNAAGSIGVVRAVDPVLTTSWLNGRLAYVGATLESVIADVNRYSETELIIGDEAIKQLEFTGTIFSNDIDNWLAGIERVFPIRLVEVDGHGILIIQSKP